MIHVSLRPIGVKQNFLLVTWNDMPDAVTRLPLPFLLERRDDIQLGSTVEGKTLNFEKCQVKVKQAPVCHSALFEELGPNDRLFVA